MLKYKGKHESLYYTLFFIFFVNLLILIWVSTILSNILSSSENKTEDKINKLKKQLYGLQKEDQRNNLQTVQQLDTLKNKVTRLYKLSKTYKNKTQDKINKLKKQLYVLQTEHQTDNLQLDRLQAKVTKLYKVTKKDNKENRYKKKIIVYEAFHNELTFSVNHRLKKYSHGSPLHGNKLKKIFYKLIRHVDNILHKAHVDYVIYAGTLLGAWRHHGFIPWDNDVDILILGSQLEVLEAYLNDLYETESIYWIKRHGLHSDVIPFKVVDSKNGYYLDIFLCEEKGDICINNFPGEFFHFEIKDLFPSKYCRFDNTWVNCPNNVSNVLKTMYGNLDIPKNKKYNNQTFSHVKEYYFGSSRRDLN